MDSEPQLVQPVPFEDDEGETSDAASTASTASTTSSSSSDRRAYGVRQALPSGFATVPDGCETDYDVDDEARDAAAYLAAVRAEAAAVRTVVAAGVGKAAPAAPPPSLPQARPPSASDAVAPDDPWLVPFLEDFAALRSAVAEERGGVGAPPPIPLPRDDTAWAAALASPPPPGLAQGLSQPDLIAALERVAAAAGGPAGVAPPGWAARQPPPPPPTPLLPGETPAWAFALAAGLERPLPPDAGAALRSLGRAAGAAAAKAAAENTTATRLPPDAMAARARAAVVAAISGAYFAQDEALCIVAREGWP